MAANAKFDIAILGAGSFGTAMAIHLANHGHKVVLWGRDSKQLEQMANSRQNRQYLTNISFPNQLYLEQDLNTAIKQSTHKLIAVPSHAFADFLSQINQPLDGVTWLTKGLEPSSNQLLHQVLKQHFPNSPFAILSGPSFAKEIATNIPTAITLACSDKQYGETMQSLLTNAHFRVYLSTDIYGVQLAGAMKNVIAIAVGISDGLGLGANSRAALVTRGLNEMSNLGAALSAEPTTFMGLAGLGDLLLTATDDQSRNRRFGLALGQGLTKEQALNNIGQVVEGLHNASQVCALGKEQHVELPICQAVNQIINNTLSPSQAVAQLMNRPIRYE